MAARTRNKLTDLEVRKATTPGWYGDGGGLYMRLDPRTMTKRWVFVYQWAGKRAEMGLGPIADVSLAEARVERDRYRKMVREGRKPVLIRRQEKAAAIAAANVHSFAQWAEEIAPVVAPKAEKAREAWLRSMTDWTGPLKSKPVGEIVTEDVLGALKPYWKSRPETGRRMRMRIEAVLDAAKAKGLIADPWANPARWKGHLQHLLEKQPSGVRHHAALPYGEMSDFVGQLRAKEPMSARALEFTVLTAARTSETIHATWAEMDLAAKVWTVPAKRMKSGRLHRVPLSDAALAVLEAVKPPNGYRPTSWVFPSLFKRGRPLSTAAMDRMLGDMGFAGKATVHGMRSSFKDWAEDATNFPNGVIEAALAHLVGDETERAYRRGDALLKRRKLMEAWAGFLAAKRGDNVRPMVKPPPSR